MKMAGGPSSLNIKIPLLLTALLIGAAMLFYTNNLVKKLQARESQIVHLYAEGLEYVANSNTDNTDITFLFRNIIQQIDFPMILTYGNQDHYVTSQADIRNVEYDTALSIEELRASLKSTIQEMDRTNDPILVTYVSGRDTTIFQKIHYGNSDLITQLRYYPYVLLAIGIIFILTGYIGFSQIKRNEQSNIWVGMAKETAHQFGTPLSSLMGWLELLKLNYKDKDKVLDTADEIESDVEKLKKITNRFSKIGSKTELKETDLDKILKNVTHYFNRRLPQTGKSVNLELEGNTRLKAMLNAELFEWVIENLIKNALDAIDHDEGRITISTDSDNGNIIIEVADNGKGIDMKRRKDVFRPGYSTKKRGWGLGLSLSKRIVENIHNGKIYVKSSSEPGTVFRIIVKSA